MADVPLLGAAAAETEPAVRSTVRDASEALAQGPVGAPVATAALVGSAIDRALAEKLGVQPLVAQELPLPPGAGLAPGGFPPVLVLSRGSVVKFSGDAVVNAANPGCQVGGGVDGAITAAGGRALKDARAKLPRLDDKGTRCETGSAVTTIGGDLRAQWCIHAVGPDYNEMSGGWQSCAPGCFRGFLALGPGGSLSRGDELLHSTYVAAMRCAQEAGAQTVGFSLLSSGIFKGRRSLKDVLAIGVAAVEQAAYPELRAVHFVAFKNEEVHALEAAAWQVWRARGLRQPASKGS